MAKTSKHLIRLVEPATIMALATVALYFWGYIYYGVFCETIGVRFQGFVVPFNDHLVAGWNTAYYILSIIAILLCIIEPLRALFKWINDKLEKKIPSEEKEVKESASPFGPLYFLGAIIITTLATVFWGAKSVVKRAQIQASYRLENPQQITVYNDDHVAIDGQFIHLIDLGGALIVGEIQEDMDKPDIRIFKDGSYSSYTLLSQKANDNNVFSKSN